MRRTFATYSADAGASRPRSTGTPSKGLRRAFFADEPEAAVEVQAHYTRADRATFALHKAYLDGVTARRLADIVRANDLALARKVLGTRSKLAHMESIRFRGVRLLSRLAPGVEGETPDTNGGT